MHLDPLHAASLLLRDLKIPQTKQDIHDWIVGQSLLTANFFDEWWRDLVEGCHHATHLQWDGEHLMMRTERGELAQDDDLFPDTLRPGARLNLALANSDTLPPHEVLDQLCRAWTEGSTQVRELALQACLNYDPNLVFERLLSHASHEVDALIHCIRSSNWVPAQLGQPTLDRLNHRATGALTPESPLDAEARLTTALLRWGHPSTLNSLCLGIQSPDGQRLCIR